MCPKRNVWHVGMSFEHYHLDHQPSIEATVRWVNARRHWPGSQGQWFEMNQRELAHRLFGVSSEPTIGWPPQSASGAAPPLAATMSVTPAISPHLHKAKATETRDSDRDEGV